MKKTNTARFFVIAILCAISALCAIFGISLLNKTSAIAEESATDVVEGATVTYDENGVTIASDSAYSGKINHTFNGDTTLRFKFSEIYEGDKNTWYDGNFVVRVTDADDDGKYFEVKYSTNHTWESSNGLGWLGYTGAHVYYGSEVRSSKYYADSGVKRWLNSDNSNDSATTAPYFRNATSNHLDGLLKIIIDENGVLSVNVNHPSNSKYTMRTIAAFDGTNEFEADVSWGLPKLEFKNGYVISFSSSFSNEKTTDRATDVLFKEIKDGDNTVEIKDGLITMVDWADFFVTGSKVEQTTDGVRISSDTPYNATIKGVFKGDTTLKFNFPETNTPESTWWDGNFVVRVTDTDDDSNYFEVKYSKQGDWGNSTNYGRNGWTHVHVYYGSEVRTSTYKDKIEWYNSIQTGEVALCSPKFRGTGEYDGILKIIIDENGILSVQVNSSHADQKTRTIAAFDETESFESGTSWGLPKLNFKNGYVISFSSSFSNENTTDQATDVTFKEITNNGITYDLTNINDSILKFDEVFQTLEEQPADQGKVFVGYKSSKDNKLYSANSIVKREDGVTYTPVSIGFDTIDGAFVRLDTSENGQSGIRFMTLFDTSDYNSYKDYIIEFGTIIAYTDNLEASKDFVYENYSSETNFAKVKNTKGLYTYNYNNTDYTAFSMAVIKIRDYSKSYSARGYFNIKYADGSVVTFYSEFDKTNNSRSISQVAKAVKKSGAYDGLDSAEKSIIDGYAGSEENQ